jgi:hypothetical protein
MAKPDVNAINYAARLIQNGLRVVARLDGGGVYYTVEEARKGRVVRQILRTSSYEAACARAANPN